MFYWLTSKLNLNPDSPLAFLVKLKFVCFNDRFDMEFSIRSLSPVRLESFSSAFLINCDFFKSSFLFSTNLTLSLLSKKYKN